MRQALTNLHVAATLTLASAAAAQVEPPPPRAGVRIGTILLTPTVTASAIYDDNIFREDSGAKSSIEARAEASVKAATDWRRHALSLEFGAMAGAFTSSPADDYLDGFVAANAIIDATRATRARFRLRAQREHERRGDDDAPTALSGPIEQLALLADATIQYAPGRLRLQPSLRIERRDFQDRSLSAGGVADQDDRDRTVIGAGIEAAYNLPGPLEAVAAADLALTDFDAVRDRNGEDRDNTTISVDVGIESEPERIVSGAVSVGFFRRSQHDARLSDVSGFAGRGSVTWSPSRLWSIRLAGYRGVEETTIANASSTLVTYAEVEGKYEVRRFVDVSASAAFERRSFRGADRRDDTVTIGAGLVWKARETVTVSFGLRHLREWSNAPGEDARSNQAWLSVKTEF
ncbi:MAG: outer membrane beta-barrel protein [Pseudomonadota bacterium]